MIFFADARRNAGWEENQITRFFLIRGLLLVFLQLLIEEPSWIFGALTTSRNALVIRGGGVPGGGHQGMIYLGVLFALGGSMIFWAFIRRVSSWLIGMISLSAILVTQFVIPGSDHVSTLDSPLLRLLLIPGHTNIWQVSYPVVPWLGVAGLGLLFGELLKRDPNRAERIAHVTGLALWALFFGHSDHGRVWQSQYGAGGVDGFLKRNQVSAEPRIFDNGPGSESLINGYGEVGWTISSKSIPSLDSVWPGGAFLLFAPFVGVESARAVFQDGQRFGNHVWGLVTWTRHLISFLLRVQSFQGL